MEVSQQAGYLSNFPYRHSNTLNALIREIPGNCSSAGSFLVAFHVWIVYDKVKRGLKSLMFCFCYERQELKGKVQIGLYKIAIS